MDPPDDGSRVVRLRAGESRKDFLGYGISLSKEVCPVKLAILAALLAPYALADEAVDRAAIEAVVLALNHHDKPLADLFTPDADGASELLWLTAPNREPFSEISEPYLRVRSIRFVTAEVALVDALSTQYGSLMMRRVPVLLVMINQSRWRISALRILMDQSRVF
jgi:hypothetical protein